MCLVSGIWSSVGLVGIFSMCCRSNMVLCMFLVLKVIAFMVGCRYDLVDFSPLVGVNGSSCFVGVMV